eukprot:970716_1
MLSSILPLAMLLILTEPMQVQEEHNGYDTVFIFHHHRMSSNDSNQESQWQVNVATTAQPTLHPTTPPTTKPTHNPTQSPTYHPTEHTTFAPSEKPTKTRTNPPTLPPTHRPTLKPTKNPTMKPTVFPTQHPTNPWDKVSNTNSPNKNKNDNSSKLFEEAKLLKHAQQQMREYAVKKEKNAQNVLHLYEYHHIPGADQEERSKAIAMHRDILMKENKLVIIKEHELYRPRGCKSDCNVEIKSFMTEVDVALETLHPLTQPCVDGSSSSVNADILTERLMTSFEALNKINSGSITRNIRSQIGETFGPLLMKLLHMDVISMEKNESKQIESECDALVLNYLFISYQELLQAKLAEIETFITTSTYVKVGKIPREFKQRFTRFQKRYDEILRMNASKSNCIGLHVWMRYHKDLSEYSFDLQCAQLIFYRKSLSDKRSLGNIAISDDVVCKSKHMDELLMVLGYQPCSIHRFKVNITTTKLHDFKFHITPFVLTTANVTSTRKRNMKKQSKSSISTATNASVTGASMTQNRSVVLISVSPNATEKANEMYDMALKDPQFDAVIICDSVFVYPDEMAIKANNLSHRYVAYELIDVVFINIFSDIIFFMNNVPSWTSHGFDRLLTCTIYHMGFVVFEYAKLESKSFIEDVIALFKERATRSGTLRRSAHRLISVIRLLYSTLKPKVRVENKHEFVASQILRFLSNDHLDSEFVVDMVEFVEFAFIHVTTMRMRTTSAIIQKKWRNNAPKSVNDMKTKVVRQITELLKGSWSLCIKKHYHQVLKDAQHQDGIKNTLRDIEELKVIMQQHMLHFARLRIVCRIGEIISEFQAAEYHYTGAIAIVGDTRSITHCVYDVLHSLGYGNQVNDWNTYLDF